MKQLCHSSWMALALLVMLAHLARAEIVQLQILQTTDLHGYVERSDQLKGGGGMLRAASAIRRRRQDFGRERTLLIDCGDTIQGTWTGAVTRGQAAIEFLKHLNYDVWVPGNHELDFGATRLAELCRQTQSFVTAGNLTLQAGEGAYSPPAWRLITRGGARVAVIGMTASAMDLWFWGKQAEGYQVTSALDRVEELLPQILALEPDMIILAAHQGWLPGNSRSINEIKRIADTLPEIDLILGGHTHWQHAGRKVGPHTWYMQAGRHADMLGVVHAEIDTEKNRVLDLQSRLMTLDESCPVDPALQERLEEMLKRSHAEGRKVIGNNTATISADGRPGVDCAKSELLCRALASATGASVVIHGRLTRYDLQPGPVTREEVFRMAPYENGIGVAELTAADIMQIMEEQQAERASYAACGLWGLQVEFDSAGQAVALRTNDGQPVNGEKRFKVAFNSYTLASSGGRFQILRRVTRQSDARLVDTGLMTRKVLEEYIRKHSPLPPIKPASR